MNKRGRGVSDRSFDSNFASKLDAKFASFLKQMWPLAVAVLRTGCILMKGYPFQVAAQQHQKTGAFSCLGCYVATSCEPLNLLIMYASKRVKTRTRSVTAKVTAEEEKQLKTRAEEAGLTLSEWVRQVLLQSVKASPETRLILSEFIAVRTILLVLHTDILQDREITEERIKLGLERADAVKLAIADKRISAFFSETAKSDNLAPA